MIFTENNKIVPCFHPADNTSGAATICDIVSMKGYDHATFIIDFGVVDNSMTGTLIAYKGKDFTTCTTAFACKYRYMAATDTFGTLTTLTTSGVSLAANAAADATIDNVLIAVEIDAADLAPTVANPYDTVRIGWTQSAHAGFVSILCILSEPRYAEAAMPTAIA